MNGAYLGTCMASSIPRELCARLTRRRRGIRGTSKQRKKRHHHATIHPNSCLEKPSIHHFRAANWCANDRHYAPPPSHETGVVLGASGSCNCRVRRHFSQPSAYAAERSLPHKGTRRVMEIVHAESPPHLFCICWFFPTCRSEGPVLLLVRQGPLQRYKRPRHRSRVSR